MAKYQLIKDGSNLIGILKKEDIAANTQVSIPIAPGNTDYEEYLEWAKSNTADAADGPSDWDIAREKRDLLLSNSDWTMVTGATVDQAQWSAYREKLRDIPQTYKGKATSEIVWPTAPSTKGPNS
jgi:hypothetical protein